MKKIILQSFTGIFCFAMITSCGKDVKTPYNKPASVAKPTSTNSTPVTQAPAQDQNNHTCGQSGTSTGQSGSYNGQGY